MPVKGQWVKQLEQMKACKRADDIARRFGPPAHKVQDGGTEIWHYPLGHNGGMLYTIHVAVTDGASPPMAYMHMEPSATLDDLARAKRPWWKFW